MAANDVSAGYVAWGECLTTIGRRRDMAYSTPYGPARNIANPSLLYHFTFLVTEHSDVYSSRFQPANQH